MGGVNLVSLGCDLLLEGFKSMVGVFKELAIRDCNFNGCGEF